MRHRRYDLIAYEGAGVVYARTRPKTANALAKTDPPNRPHYQHSPPAGFESHTDQARIPPPDALTNIVPPK